MKPLRQLVEALVEPPLDVRGDVDRPIESLVVDSRKACPGALFFALPGERHDGREFAAEAVRRGAVAVAAGAPVVVDAEITTLELGDLRRSLSRMAAAFHDWPSRRLCAVGVTGTNGKTTVTHILESIWAAAGWTPGVIGTIRYRAAGREWPAPFTTPQASDFQALLAEMVEIGTSHVAAEVSSHALALARVDDVDWNGVVFTNLTRDHLDFHGDMERYFEEKARLFTELLPASGKAERFAVVHVDDAYGRRLVEGLRALSIPDLRILTFGRAAEADLRPGEVSVDLDGISGTLEIEGSTIEFRSSLIGTPHLENLMAAVAVAHAQGLAPGVIAAGLESCTGVPGRMERVDAGGDVAVLVDYAHTDDALRRSLEVLGPLTTGRRIVVFGCGGDRDRGKRPIMGRAAALASDLAILTSDNPRTEDPMRILADVEVGITEAGARRADLGAKAARGFAVIADRRQAIRAAVAQAEPGDVVLIAGKGHEDYQIVGRERRHFDDREEARAALEAHS